MTTVQTVEFSLTLEVFRAFQFNEKAITILQHLLKSLSKSASIVIFRDIFSFHFTFLRLLAIIKKIKWRGIIILSYF